MGAIGNKGSLRGRGNETKSVPLICYPSSLITSKGLWNGDRSLDYSLPLLMLQACTVITCTRIVHFLLKPLKQPKIVSEIIGGILIGPSVLGRSKAFSETVFPYRGDRMMQITGKIGLVYCLFLIGVKMDPRMIAKTGRKAMSVAAWGFFLPYATVTILSFLFSKFIAEDVSQGTFLAFVAASLSITAFPVLQAILEELNLLNSDVGQLAMASSMINDAVGWFFMAIFGIIQHSGADFNKCVTYVTSLSALVIFIVCGIRPWVLWIIKRTPEGQPVANIYIAHILLLVLVTGLLSDYIGATVVDGPLILGLALPDGFPIGAALVEKAEMFVNGILLPLFFAYSGLLTDIFSIKDWKMWWILQTIILAGYAAKMFGTTVCFSYCKASLKDALTLGLIMNFRGLVEISTFILWKEIGYLTDQSYAILIISTIVVTAITTPLVRTTYKPGNQLIRTNYQTIQNLESNTEFRILACVHTQDNVPSIATLIHASHANKSSPICTYLLHLVQLTGRATPFLIQHKPRRHHSITISDTDRIANAFKRLVDNNGDCLSVLTFLAMSPYKTMHEDICKLAFEKKASIIIIPYHKRRIYNGRTRYVDPVVQSLNINVLNNAPCSVGILVDRGLGGITSFLQENVTINVGVIFLSGSDDRESLAYSSRMAKHPGVNLTVCRLIPLKSSRDAEMEKQLDTREIEEFRTKNMKEKRIIYEEKKLNDGVDLVSLLRSMKHKFDLLIVGRRRGVKSPLTDGLTEWSESPELGVLGDFLASPDFGRTVSVLVVQQLRAARAFKGYRSMDVYASQGRRKTPDELPMLQSV